MQGQYSLFPILILALLLAGCAASGNAPSNEIKAIEQNPPAAPTDLPETPSLIASAVVPQNPPASCPITGLQDPPFVPPSPYDTLGFEGEFWHGTSSLWTALPQNGIWAGLPHNIGGYTQKVFWWRQGYVWNEEPEPDLVVTGERLDAAARPLIVSRATNAYAGDIGSAMLVGVDFPTRGCWKITGKYQDAELSFVVWVAP